MKKFAVATFATALATLPIAATAQSAEAVDSGMTIYFQMGGNPGDAATLARELGARDAARVLNVDLREQHSGWNPQKMLKVYSFIYF